VTLCRTPRLILKCARIFTACQRGLHASPFLGITASRLFGTRCRRCVL
jgi:hypothetical protein